MIDEHAIGERFRALAGEFDERPAIRKSEESGIPFLHFRDANRDLCVVALPLEGGAMVIGRGGSVDVVLDWDDRVSRIHARLESVGGDWTIEDDGLSRNGTFVNGERVPDIGDCATAMWFRSAAQLWRSGVPKPGTTP